ncbi:hypothetical protein QBC38DRAFT_493996 [Podospora fimiseda]|uniref:DUF7580 domain-containing protein n=1 Tax=Podospora fimiseda TaxID=252190 RepID=A0AAN6YLG7_9PEZI|nr:hypothetical protein QBC38DRAFT_493996 [Podospora fimiseda]
MSGFEIVGVVLGALPLLIESIKGYKEAAKVVNLVREFPIELTKCKIDLKFEHHILNETLRSILGDRYLSEADIRYIFRDMDADQTKNLLQERLGGSEAADLFVHYLELISHHLENLKQKFSTQRLEGPQSVRDIFEALKFALSESTRNGVFTDISGYNEKLGRLTKPITGPRTHIFNTPTKEQLEAFSEHASLLHKGIESVWACQCEWEHGDRSGNLILTDRRWLTMALKPPNFDIIFKVETPTTNLCPIAETRVEVETIAQPDPTDIRLTRARPLTLYNDRLTPTLTVQTLTPQLRNTPSTKISNLCSLLAPRPDCDVGQGYVELLASNERQIHITFTPKDPPCHFEASTPTRTLKDALTILSRRQRFHLAAMLASSFLQLAGSPWLKTTGWTKDDIVFPADGQGIHYDKPVIIADFQTPTTATTTGTATTNTRITWDLNHSLLSLSILLLELWFGEAVEDCKAYRSLYPVDRSPPTANQLVFVAILWNQVVADEIGDDYFDALESIRKTRLIPSPDWRKTMIKDVIEPLKRNLKDTWGQERSGGPGYSQ